MIDLVINYEVHTMIINKLVDLFFRFAVWLTAASVILDFDNLSRGVSNPSHDFQLTHIVSTSHA